MSVCIRVGWGLKTCSVSNETANQGNGSMERFSCKSNFNMLKVVYKSIRNIQFII